MDRYKGIILASLSLLWQISALAENTEMQILISHFKPHVKILNKPTFVYHYVNLRDERYGQLINLTNPDHPLLDMGEAVQVYLKNKIVSYWSNEGQFSGSRTDCDGLYASSDPFQSRDFGYLKKIPGGFGKDWMDPDWVLFRIELPKGLQYLDLSDSWWSKWTPNLELVHAFNSMGCSEPVAFRYLFKKGYHYWEKNLRCREIALMLLKELNAQSIFYPWVSGTQFKNGVTSSDEAMILLDEKLITTLSTRVFTRVLPEEHHDPDRLERIILENLAKDVVLTKAPGTDEIRENNRPFWRELSDSIFPKIEEWEREHLHLSGSEDLSYREKGVH